MTDLPLPDYDRTPLDHEREHGDLAAAPPPGDTANGSPVSEATTADGTTPLRRGPRRVAGRRDPAVAASNQWLDDEGVREPRGSVHAWGRDQSNSLRPLVAQRRFTALPARAVAGRPLARRHHGRTTGAVPPLRRRNRRAPRSPAVDTLATTAVNPGRIPGRRSAQRRKLPRSR
jgi:hypothetical protein